MEWIENGRHQYRTKFDGEVVIKAERDNKVLFKFRKNSFYKILEDNEYIVVAREGEKIYFKGSDSKRGFKLGKYGENTRTFKIKRDALKLTDDLLGEYNLDYNSELGLCYINLYKKLEKELSWRGAK